MVFIGIAMTGMLIGCGDSGTKSNKAEITALTLKIGNKDYAPGSGLTITGMAITVIIPQAPPGSVTVEAVTLSAGAKGLAVGDSLTLVNGSATIPITAEDGTTEASYTLTVTKPVVASELVRSADVVNGVVPDKYRVNFGAFSLHAGSTNSAGEYRLAVRPTSADAPSAQDIKDSAATIVRRLSTTAINIYLSFHMDTDLFDATSDWTTATYQGAGSASSLKYATVQKAMLAPGTAYTLYAVSETDANGEVLPLLSFTTDAIPDSNTAPASFFSNPMGHTYTLRNGEPLLLGMWHGASKMSGDMFFRQVVDGNSTSFMSFGYARNEDGFPAASNAGTLLALYYGTSFVTSSPRYWIILQKALNVGSTITNFKIEVQHGSTGTDIAPGTDFVLETEVQ